ncbi:MAG: ureidoglycolate lyase [Rhodobacteraceae bacterium]|nr:ureidoglycolate lyase [Paracoccaceae bacterium]
MSRILNIVPLSATAFAPYGDVIELAGAPDKLINQGMCGRHHDLAKMDFSNGRAGISLFDAKARHLPYLVDMVERHPEGSQAFIPITQTRFLVVVAEDMAGKPVNLKVFITAPGQSINLHRNVWHGVLAPFEKPGVFAVVDRIGDGANLEEHWFQEPFLIETVAT